MSQNTNKDNFNKGLKEIASGVSFIGDNLSLAAKKTKDSKRLFLQSRSEAKNRDIPALPPPNEFDDLQILKMMMMAIHNLNWRT